MRKATAPPSTTHRARRGDLAKLARRQLRATDALWATSCNSSERKLDAPPELPYGRSCAGNAPSSRSWVRSTTPGLGSVAQIVHENSLVDDPGDHRSARVHAELGEDPTKVRGHGPAADIEGMCDRLVRIARGDQTDDLAFAWAQRDRRAPESAFDELILDTVHLHIDEHLLAAGMPTVPMGTEAANQRHKRRLDVTETCVDRSPGGSLAARGPC